MADKNMDDLPNDEYQIDDLQGIEGEHTQTEEIQEVIAENPTENNIKPKIIMAIGGLIVLFVLYKVAGLFFSKKIEPEKLPVPTSIVQPMQIEKPVTNTSDIAAVKSSISSLENMQSNIKTDIDTVNSQVSTLNNSVTTLTSKLESLTATINALSAKVDANNTRVLALENKVRTKHSQAKIMKKPIQRPQYYVQAIIPGRAWIISSNGATLTVREGTAIQGLGLVRLIDATQGRVVMSSGVVIRFNQQDS